MMLNIIININDIANKVRSAALTGLSLATGTAITATDTVLSAFGKLQKQITDNLATLTSHTSNTSNPHSVTKSQVGLSNVDNTSDADKPVSTAQQAALDLKQNISSLFIDVMALVLTGFAAGANTAVAATDTLAQALAKFQGQINARPNETAATIGTLIDNAGAATPNNTDNVATSESATLKKITWTNVKAFLKTYFDTIYQAILTAASLGDFIVALTGKTTPVDADTIILSDSAASDDAKKVTIANFKTALGVNAWVDYSATSTVVGWSAFTKKLIRYQVFHKGLRVQFDIAGTSNATTVTFTLPSANAGLTWWGVSGGVNNSTFSGEPQIVIVTAGGSTCEIYRNFTLATWTSANNKSVAGEFFIETA